MIAALVVTDFALFVPLLIIIMSAASSSSSVAPVLRLYRDALQSVFQWCTVGELHHVRAVCANWLNAVESMPSLKTDAFCPAESLNAAVRSSLSRHIGCFLRVPTARDRRNHLLPVPAVAFDMALLSLLHQRTPNLHTLSWHPMSDAEAGLQFPAQLTSLHLSLVNVTSEQLNPVIEALSKLAILEHLSLEFSSIEGVEFAALSSLPRLASLTFGQTLSQHEPEWSDAQLKAIRACRSLVTLEMPRSQPETIARLLTREAEEPELFPLLTALPGALVVRNDASAAVLQSFPQLTDLGCSFRGDSLDFLKHFDRLRTLKLASALSQLTAETTVAGLVQCSDLTSLTLQGSNCIKPADVTTILRQCSQINTLNLFRCSGIHSLEFLLLHRLATDLVDLELQYCTGINEACVLFLLPLRSLRRLKLVRNGQRDEPTFFHQNLRTLRAELPGLRTLEFDVTDSTAQARIDAILAEE